MIVEYLTCKTGLSDRELISDCERFGFTDFLENVPVPYFETEHYIYKDVSDVPKEGFYLFFGETFIAIDQSVKKQDL